MAENGLRGNPNLLSPFAYRFATPLLPRCLMQVFPVSTKVAFTVIAYLGAIGLSSDNLKWTSVTMKNARANKSNLSVLSDRFVAQTNVITLGNLRCANALHALTEFDNQAVMNGSIDGCRCSQGFLKI